MAQTPTYGLPYPTDYAQPADTPAVLEDLALATESALAGIDARSTKAGPIGSIVMWPGNAAPEGWHLCNGTPHGSSALQSILGSANTPDLRDRFIVGAGTSYAVGATGGATAVTLTAAQSGLRDHNHSASAGYQSEDHSHYVSLGGGDHNHISSYASQMLINMDAAGSGYNMLQQTADYISGGGHGHAGQSNGVSANHYHGVTVNNSGAADAATSHENRPPYYALTYIIRKE